MTGRSLLIVAGEVSGDIHAGNLLTELRALEPRLSAFGVGGERLAAGGLEGIGRTEELSHMGFVEVLRELPRIHRLMGRVVAECARRRPSLAILVDSPDFNLRLAARLAGLGTPVVLYVSPQLWAWRRGRVRTVRRLAREVLCILPFEVEFYREHGVAARYVGHPLVDEIARLGLLEHTIAAVPRRLALLPGSRPMEIRQLLPTMIEALGRIDSRVVTDAVLVEAPGVGRLIEEVLGRLEPEPRLRRVRGEDRRTDLASCSLAWTASGTATLECALLDVPMIVGYRLQALSYLLAKLLVDVPHIALANLIARRRAFPELIQGRWHPADLAATTTRLMAHDLEASRAELQVVRQRLGPPGASRRAAEAVLEHLARA